jgi:hypothetical protein
VKSEYDMNSAITFLLVGLGIGSFLAIVLSPRTIKSTAEAGINWAPKETEIK